MSETNIDLPGSSVLLQGDNYAEWSVEIRNSLQSKQMLGFIDGSIPKPLTNPDLTIWLKTNSMIVDWILKAIVPKLRSTVETIANAKVLWDTLQSRLSLGIKARIYQLKVNIFACKQDGQRVDDYFSRLCHIWLELDCYKSTVVCSCDAAKDIKKEREDERVYQFLIGLDDDLLKSKIAFIITNTAPLPNLYQTYCLVSEEERFKALRSNELKPLSDEQRRDKHVSLCSHCGRKGHDVEDCYALHGYPESRHEPQRNKSTNTRGRRGKRASNSGKLINTQGRLDASQTKFTNNSLRSTGLIIDQFNTFMNLGKMQNISSPGSLASSSNRFSMVEKLEAKGGNGGKEWDDGADHEGVSQIFIQEGCEGIESIKFDYVKNGKLEAGTIHGRLHHRFTECYDLVYIDDHEYIQSVECYFYEGAIHGIVIRTNITTTPFMGNNIGTKFTLEVKGKKIIGFHGSFDKNLKSLGAYFTKLSPTNLK